MAGVVCSYLSIFSLSHDPPSLPQPITLLSPPPLPSPHLQAVDSSKWRVWCALEAHLTKYHALLLGRSEALEEVAGLAAQNEELRALLNQYLGSKINADLKIPPTAVL